MADYHSPTVVTPHVPFGDVTPLEALLLPIVFDESAEEDGSYFHSWCGPSDVITVEIDAVRKALDESRSLEFRISAYVTTLLAAHEAIPEEDRPDDLDIDLTAGPGWDEMLQDIVRRSSTLDEIVVTAAFTCTKMRPDGFGGSVMRITADAVQYASTVDMLETTWNTPAPSAPVEGGGHDARGRIEAIAASTGWDSFTLLLLIAQWLDRNQLTDALVEHLGQLASNEEG
ncbi:hypothetical protein NIBR502774_18025 (plasmid) [Rhizobium sp. NIBRBAC000502774]|nr:hypothetical protein NIBR502774_18025 [Rhizobium sp. NIBRBAC000502774]